MFKSPRGPGPFFLVVNPQRKGLKHFCLGEVFTQRKGSSCEGFGAETVSHLVASLSDLWSS